MEPKKNLFNITKVNCQGKKYIQHNVHREMGS